MGNTPKKVASNYFTGADIEVNDPSKGGIKADRQPGADTEDETKAPAKKRVTKKAPAKKAPAKKAPEKTEDDSAPADDK